MNKISKGMAPNYLTQLFNICDNQSYNLRSNDVKLALAAKHSTNSVREVFRIEGLCPGTI